MPENSSGSLAHIGDRKFFCLNFTQFLGTLNDNLYKWLLIFLLISLKGAGASNLILSIAGAVSVVPFVILSSICGKLADNHSKTTILRLCKGFEIFIMLAGVVAFSVASEVSAYFVLFLLAVHSTLFGPAKYGILPELFPPKEVPAANGWLSMFSNIGIIMGGFLAAWVTDLTDHDFELAGYFCVALALMGFALSFGIPRAPSLHARKKLHLSFWSELKSGLEKASQIPYLKTVLVGNALFYVVAAYCQLNVVSYAMSDMGLSHTAGGYLSPALAIGIGVGAVVAGKASKGSPRLDFLWKAGIGVGFCFISLLFSCFSFALTAILLFTLGFFGGFYIVPTDSFTQMKTPQEHRGEMIGTSNVLAFTGVLAGSALIYFLGDCLLLTPKEGFLTVGFLSLGLSFLLKTALKSYKPDVSC